MITNSQWLLENLDNPNLIIIDCRFRLSDPAWGYQQYLLSHLPQAYYLDLDLDLSGKLATHGGRHPLPDAAVFTEKLNKIGVNSASIIVAYDDNRFAFAARLWWLLRYFGHQQVMVLDGGFSAWVSSGYPVTSDIPLPKQGNFSPIPQLEKIATREELITSENTPEIVLIDSRASDRYLGKREPLDPVAGHIPGAINFPWLDVSTSEGYFLSSADQEQIWQKLPPHDSIIVYCGSGVTACVNLLSLDSLGITNTKLYLGGWSDWCSYLI
ncbi:MAG: sulfurtransferase [Gloeocapsa sp. DLM2.Bin57]|nr:MAG: sulfurtransferase [Gloeocapsa sp. DLM2.Bin57]